MQRNTLVRPIAAILLGMCAIQLGASLAKGLFPVMGAIGATTLRLLLAALMLGVVFRPWRGASLRGQWPAIAGYGCAVGFMNLFYYLALSRVPMGVVVAVEFIGPLAVAIAASRRALDFAWVVLAIAGLALLLPQSAGAAPLDRLGLAYAAMAGVGWGLYIVYGSRSVATDGPRVVALGMAIGAAVALPVALLAGGTALFNAAALPIGLAVAFLSSALPYTLEMYAMRRMPTRVFGIFMSVEPALAALVGLAMLGEQLSTLQWLAIGCVMVASFGSAWTSRREQSP